MKLDDCPDFGPILFSVNGDEAMAAFKGRVRPHLDGLLYAWKSRDYKGMTAALERCALAADSADIRAKDTKLRYDIVSRPTDPKDVAFDVLVHSKICEALLRHVVGDQPELLLETVEALTVAPSYPTEFSFDYRLRLFLTRLYIESGMTAEAMAAANRNLGITSSCPHSQFHLYLALKAHQNAGRLKSSANVAIQDLSDRFCNQPFDTLASRTTRGTRGAPALCACHCPGILPFPVSDGTYDQDIDKIWNGQEIQEIRRSVLDGDFTYCSRLNCPEILGGSLPKKAEITDPRHRDIIDNHRVELKEAPRMLSLSHDPSCNLACPSCRLEVFNIKNDKRELLDRFSQNVLLPLLEDARVSVVLSADGDPFASKHYRNLMRGLDPRRHAKVKIQFLTNGLLLTEREWAELTNVHGMVESVAVSIDAAEAETYEDLRRPGKWQVIVQNMEFLSRLKRAGKVPYAAINFVVQQKNYRQMPKFVKMAQDWGFDRALFLKLINIGSFSEGEFMDNDVCDPRHPEHNEFLAILRDPIFKTKEAELYTVKPYLALAEAAAPAMLAAE